MASGRRSSREASARLSQPPVTWLPQVRPKLLMPSTRVSPFIEGNLPHHPFLAFASALYEEKQDSHQGGMVAKVYAFLHDYMPQGLTGKWAHIRGNDIMDVLLCYTKSFSRSRHKATAGASSAFDYLEEWMGKGTNWKEAARNAAFGAEKTKPGRRAPTLYSPAALVALLVICYPEADFLERIGRLRIDWMMGPHEQVEVHSGFWEGITQDDFYIFQREETRHSEVPLLADYDRLFGEDFARARKDVRPFVPDWARGCAAMDRSEVIELSDEDGSLSSDREMADGDDASARIDSTPAGSNVNDDPDISELRAHLFPGPAPPTDELRAWLVARCGQSDDVAVRLWREHWVGRLGGARCYQEQGILQSLFLQGLRRLHSLSGSASLSSLVPSLMLLDIEDGSTREARPSIAQAVARLRTLDSYKPAIEAGEQLVGLAAAARRELVRTALAGQLDYFYGLVKDQRLNRYSRDVLRLDTMRTRVLVEGTAHGDAQSAVTTDEADRLHLTKWQMRALAVADIAAPDVLTEWQDRAYRGTALPGLPEVQDACRYGPVDAVDDGPAAENLDPEMREDLRKLFGRLPPPPDALQGDSIAVAVGDGHAEPAGSPQPPAASSHHSAASTPTPCTVNGGANGHAKESPRPQASNAKAQVNATPKGSWAGFIERHTAKRVRSPDARSAKFPRLAGTHTAAATEEMRTDLVARSEQLREAVTSAKDEIVEFAEERSVWISEQVTRRLLRDRQQLEAGVQSVKEALDVKLQSVVDSLGVKVQSATDAIKTQLADERRQTAAALQGLAEGLEALRQSVLSPATPGRDGYLTAQCPAPSGSDQKEYESMLLRAGWFYVAELGHPDEGFQPNDDAFDLTVDRFPSVDIRHLTIALEHVHRQAYNRPLEG